MENACSTKVEDPPGLPGQPQQFNLPGDRPVGTDTRLAMITPLFRESHDLAWQSIYARLRVDRDDRIAFEALWRRVARWANRQLYGPGLLRELREDVVAETCAATILGIEHAYGADTFSGFVFGQFLTARRRYLRYARLEIIALEDVHPAGAYDDEPQEDELALLEACLLELRPRERQAVELRYFACASSTEIASALDVSTTNARRIVFNGLQRLRRGARGRWPSGRWSTE
jgi:RNA polymerase sigma factor (sigma-70 family)